MRLEGAAPSDRIASLKAGVDGALRTRRFLGHRESIEWAQDATPVVDELAKQAVIAPFRQLYSRLIEATLAAADKRAYRTAIRDLERARRAADAASLSEEFDDDVTALRQHRRRPTLIAMLDKAGLRWRWEPGAEDSGRKSRPGRSRRPRSVTL